MLIVSTAILQKYTTIKQVQKMMMRARSDINIITFDRMSKNAAGNIGSFVHMDINNFIERTEELARHERADRRKSAEAMLRVVYGIRAKMLEEVA